MKFLLVFVSHLTTFFLCYSQDIGFVASLIGAVATGWIIMLIFSVVFLFCAPVLAIVWAALRAISADRQSADLTAR
ncbi:hypothetical protein [uncultured Desulfuromusa sp.]|uniref:hypothetical protein n=1 Tax=uncultured Desulfuromusa sp. TaxID=219183 RepID=UPI002AA78EC3|nr:hypothetical protein [uncultured Desulfuromusa sp.]